MKVMDTEINPTVIDLLWRKVENRRSFNTNDLFWPARDLLNQDKELAFSLVRRLVVKWKNEGKIRKPENSKRNAPWEIV